MRWHRTAAWPRGPERADRGKDRCSHRACRTGWTCGETFAGTGASLARRTAAGNAAHARGDRGTHGFRRHRGRPEPASRAGPPGSAKRLIAALAYAGMGMAADIGQHLPAPRAFFARRLLEDDADTGHVRQAECLGRTGIAGQRD